MGGVWGGAASGAAGVSLSSEFNERVYFHSCRLARALLMELFI